MSRRVTGQRQTLPDDVKTRLADMRNCLKVPGRPQREESQELNAYLAALVEKGHWSLTVLGQELSLTRERVRQRVNKALSQGVAVEYIDVPVWVQPVIPKVYARVRPTISPELSRELRKLQDVARTLRGATGNTPARRASETLSARLNQLILDGYWVADLARTINVKPITIRARLSRFGYRNLPPSQEGNRYQGAVVRKNGRPKVKK